MRSSLFFAVLLGAVALGVLIVTSHSGTKRSTSRGGTVTLLGDSLNVGVERYLSRTLPGWRVVPNDLVGRTTPAGIVELRAGRPPLSSHVVISLGTNDSPGAVSAFRADVATVLGLIGPNRCIAWATIWRDGAPDDAFNAVLRDAAAANHRLRIVEWAEMVRAHPDLLAPDGLHGNEKGYLERAKAVAEATRGCVPAQLASAQ
jgi:hypothetical protein